MKVLRKNWIIAVLGLFFLTGATCGFAAEHPKEHPSEHPTKKAAAKLDKDSLAVAIARYVNEDSELKGGFFLVFDDANDEPLVLSLAKVHKERLSHIGHNIYFACADFKTPQGKIYDLDIFMAGTNSKDMEINQITVHKESGEARYTWFEKSGVWKMKSKDGKPISNEHPSEHPSEHPR